MEVPIHILVHAMGQISYMFDPGRFRRIFWPLLIDKDFCIEKRRHSIPSMGQHRYISDPGLVMFEKWE